MTYHYFIDYTIWLAAAFVIICWPTNAIIRCLIFYVEMRLICTCRQERRPSFCRNKRDTLIQTLRYAWDSSPSEPHEFHALPRQGGPDAQTLDILRNEEKLTYDIYRDVIRAGPWTGILERIIVITLSILHQFEAVAFVMAAKGLIVEGMRDKTGVGDQDEKKTGTKQETYLLGTFASFAIAIVGGLLLGGWGIGATIRDQSDTPRRQAAPSPRPGPGEAVTGGRADDGPIGPRLNRPALADRGREEGMSAAGPNPVLMDVDTGVDDALAVILALHARDRIDLVGITTVSGNINNEQAALNTYFLLDQYRLGETIPVVVGAARSLHGREPDPVPEIHGPDGLGGISQAYWSGQPVKRRDQALRKRDAVGFILEMAKRRGNDLTLVATAPLTNIALAIRKDPATMRKIGRLLIMAGALDEKGNVTEFAEFNAHCDPEALDIVLRSGIPITLFPLDVTHRIRLLKSSLTPELGIGEDQLRLVRAMAKTYIEFHSKKYSFNGSYMHDASPVLWLIDPTVFSSLRGAVVVERAPGDRSGQVRWARPRPDEQGVEIEVVKGVDVPRYLETYWKQLSRPTVECRFVEGSK